MRLHKTRKKRSSDKRKSRFSPSSRSILVQTSPKKEKFIDVAFLHGKVDGELSLFLFMADRRGCGCKCSRSKTFIVEKGGREKTQRLSCQAL